MTIPKQPSDLMHSARDLGEHHARQHFANHLAAAGDALVSEMAEAERELAGQTVSNAEMKQAVNQLRTSFREEWERLYAHAISGLET